MQEPGFDLGWTSVVSSAWLNTRKKWRSVLKPFVFWSGITIATLAIALTFGSVKQSTTAMLLLGLLSLIPAVVGSAAVAINWHRSLLLNTSSSQWSGLDNHPGVWGYLWRAAIFGVLGTIVANFLTALGYLPANVINPETIFVQFMQDPPYLVAIPVLIIQSVVATRLGVRLPAYAVDDPSMDTQRVWRATGPYKVHMAVTFVLITLAIMGVSLVFGVAGAILGLVLGRFLTFIMVVAMIVPIAYLAMLFSLSVLTLYYAALVGRKDLFQRGSTPPSNSSVHPRRNLGPGFSMNIPR